MKEAMFYEKTKDKEVVCHLCPRNCPIKEGGYGVCGVRKNIDGKLYSLVYARPVAIDIDPIEKKPLFHFIPGSYAYSLGTVGCNLFCLHCQNWQIARAKPTQYNVPEVEPEQIVEGAIANNCKTIAYTYTEPTVFYEYVYDIARIARKNKIKNVMITNGYINEEPIKKLYKYIDGANIDIKAFTEKFYKQETASSLKPVLNAIKKIKQQGTWIEITNLIIPTLNDNPDEIKEMTEWIKKNLGKDTPLHFTAFYPAYKRMDIPPTSLKILEKAYKIAKDTGLSFVYLGNVMSEKENTYCPKCGALLIERKGLFLEKNNLVDGKCPKCGQEIKGVWK